MKFVPGYKYQLAKAEVTKTSIQPEETLTTEWLMLDTDGILTIEKGYAWDGPSGPTYDSRNSLRASLIHDALYQLIRLELLPPSHRRAADLDLDRILKEDGMWSLRRWYWLRGVRWFASGAIDPDNVKKILDAPYKLHNTKE